MEQTYPRMSLVEKALVSLVRNGHAKLHTAHVKMADETERDFTFYKLEDSTARKQRKIIPQEEIHRYL